MKKANPTSTDVSTRQTTELAELPDMGDYAIDLAQEEFSKDDMVQPRLKLLQPTSPQCKAGKDGYLEGAKAGMYYLTSTQQLFPDVFLVPVTMEKREVEYTYEGADSKFVAEHLEHSAIVNNVTDVPNPSDPNRRDVRVVNYDGTTIRTHLVNTAVWHVLVVNPTEQRWERATFSMKGLQLGASSKWLTKMMAIKIPGTTKTPAFFWRMYKASHTFDKSGDWIVSQISEYIQFDLKSPDLNDVERQLYTSLILDAAAYLNDIKAGSVKVDHDEGV